MNFKFKHPKFKPKLLIFTIAMLLSISAFTVIFQSPIQTYASGTGNGTGESDDTDLNEKNGQGYPSWGKTGWLVYLVNSSGELKSEVAFVSSKDSTYPNDYYNGLLTSRIGGVMPSSRYTNAEFGAPFDTTGAGRGEIIKTELITGNNYSDDGSLNGFYVVKKYLGEEALKLFKEDPTNHYLILETAAWHKIFTGTAAGTYAVASSSGWAKLQSLTGIADTGDGSTGWCDNFRLQRSCHLDQVWDGLPAVPTYIGSNANTSSGRIGHSLINQNLGYGMIAVRGIEGGIHTYNGIDSPGEPETAEPPRDGLCSIVKCYYEHNLTTGEKTIVGEPQYIRELCTNQISIDNEPEFQVEEWVISTTTNKSITALTWNTPSPTRTGKGAASVTLQNPETCVYVLLKKVIEEPSEEMDYNYKITQSQITRRVHFSKVDNENQMPKIQDYKFLFQNPAHTIECGGHTCDEGCVDAACNCSLEDGQTCTTNHGKTSMKQ